MRNRKILFILLIPLVAQGKVIEGSGYTLVHSQTGDTIEYTYDAATKIIPLNSLIIASQDGTNNITIKGKLADNPEDPVPPTIENRMFERMIKVDGYSYTLRDRQKSGAVLLADQSYQGKNNITFENTNIVSYRAPVGIMSFDQINSSVSPSLAPTTLTFKGRNNINIDVDVNVNESSTYGILLFNNSEKVGGVSHYFRRRIKVGY